VNRLAGYNLDLPLSIVPMATGAHVSAFHHGTFASTLQLTDEVLRDGLLTLRDCLRWAAS
jgi:hypothetical protein